MNREISFAEKNFAVVGSSSGIGRQVTRDLVDCGANVFAVGRNLDRLNELKSYAPTKIFPAQVDVTTATAETWENALNNVIANFGRLHGAVYTAGIRGLTPLMSFDEEFAHKIFDTSFRGAVNFLKTALQKKFMHRKSAFVVMSSFSGNYPSKGLFAYSAAKAAIQAAVETFAKEIIKDGHRINSVAPAFSVDGGYFSGALI